MLIWQHNQIKQKKRRNPFGLHLFDSVLSSILLDLLKDNKY